MWVLYRHSRWWSMLPSRRTRPDRAAYRHGVLHSCCFTHPLDDSLGRIAGHNFCRKCWLPARLWHQWCCGGNTLEGIGGWVPSMGCAQQFFLFLDLIPGRGTIGGIVCWNRVIESGFYLDSVEGVVPPLECGQCPGRTFLLSFPGGGILSGGTTPCSASLIPVERYWWTPIGCVLGGGGSEGRLALLLRPEVCSNAFYIFNQIFYFISLWVLFRYSEEYLTE